jgi:hypothetical protein
VKPRVLVDLQALLVVRRPAVHLAHREGVGVVGVGVGVGLRLLRLLLGEVGMAGQVLR